MCIQVSVAKCHNIQRKGAPKLCYETSLGGQRRLKSRDQENHMDLSAEKECIHMYSVYSTKVEFVLVVRCDGDKFRTSDT